MSLFSTSKHRDGRCRCGALAYRMAGAAKFTFACHCNDCQALTASAFSLGMVFDESQFTLMSGTPQEWSKTGSSGKPSIMARCPVCGTWISTRPQSQPGMIVIRPSSLEDHRWFRPVAQIYTRSALPWALMPVQFSYEEEFSDPAPIAKAYAAGGIEPE